MQLQSQCVRVQLQEYRGNQFIKGTSKQFRVYNVSVDELMDLVRRAVEREAAPVPVVSMPLPPVVATPIKPRRVLPAVKPPKPRRHLSPESRAKIAASQTKRWETRSRVLSEEAKRKISESQKARWARKHKVEDFDLPIDLPRNNAPHERQRSFAEIKTQPLGNGMYVGV